MRGRGAIVQAYVVRHCAAIGQEPEAPLSDAGRAQAGELADALADAGITRIVCSPFRRARDSIAPLAARLGLTVEQDARLEERVLSLEQLPEWRAALRASFDDPELRLPGGESGREATARAVAALNDAVAVEGGLTCLVTHGTLMTLLLRHFDAGFGYEAWARLTNPDVFSLTLDGARRELKRIWR
jgi:2,3-bisphosphoglycerate-dependent phosphoglycerate mutase